MGAVERAARKDLSALPPEYRSGAVARAYLMLGRRLDQGVSARDAAQLTREMRLCLLALYQLAPARHESDPVDELKARRETRMASEAPVATGEK
jgi:hypothetical protein